MCAQVPLKRLDDQNMITDSPSPAYNDNPLLVLVK